MSSSVPLHLVRGRGDLVDDLARALAGCLGALDRSLEGALDRGTDGGDGVSVDALAVLLVLLVLLLVLRHSDRQL